MRGLMTLIFCLYNTKKEQVSVLNKLTKILSIFENIDNHSVIFAGGFNIFSDA